MPAERILQLEVRIRYTEPPIWRRLLVPASVTLRQLHAYLQVAFGWEEDHVHAFEIRKQRYVGYPGDAGRQEPNDEWTAQLGDLVRARSRFTYTYDFGDDWVHEVRVEQALPRDPDIAYPRCTGGEGAGPPEDCGGVGGYYSLLELERAAADESHPDPEAREKWQEWREWGGEELDPLAFDLEAVNRALAKAATRDRRRARKWL